MFSHLCIQQRVADNVIYTHTADVNMYSDAKNDYQIPSVT